jgi:hypothetical protein
MMAVSSGEGGTSAAKKVASYPKTSHLSMKTKF